MDEYKLDKICAHPAQRFQQEPEYIDSAYAYDGELLIPNSTYHMAPVRLPVRDTILLRALHAYHDSAVSAHLGVTKTYLAV
ncbi:hypothetical protein GN244_ATG01566 [Phytophthora infestans]|uniref:Integrase zinc-binding domain-containing protein n=1 Tax=Phytophthora infestans TaxID=4787 RepID=A0A833T1W5_PHYIN|nr:hypothetical protein GN244_ATG01566 [Phytophthora infestans]